MIDKPQFWIVAGPNGSGKTTLTYRHDSRFHLEVPIINPDEIARQIDPNFVEDSNVAMQAGKKAITLQNQMFQSRESFIIETTLSGNRERKLIRKAIENGYKTNLVYTALASPFDNVNRVKGRVEAGGHNIPAPDIIRRYQRSLKNVPEVLAMVDRAFILDNSNKKHRLLASVKNNNLIIKGNEKRLPEWASNTLSQFVDLKIVQLSAGLSQDSKNTFNEAKIQLANRKMPLKTSFELQKNMLALLEKQTRPISAKSLLLKSQFSLEQGMGL